VALIEFIKIQGTGNDFIFVDLRGRDLGQASQLARPEIVRRLCDRQFGIGADGLIFVESASAGADYDLNWDFYNNDGSMAEMCGNAARCMGRWAYHVLNLSTSKFMTVAGVVRAEVVNDDISVFLDFVKLEFKDLDGATLVNTGVPHAVVEVESLSEILQTGASATIDKFRFHAQAGARGANVTFLVRSTPLQTVTFERGIEDFTLACGTGVLAAAAVALRGKTQLEADVVAPGGKLHVRFLEGQGAVLSGRADISFYGSADPDLILITRQGAK
jgi:diaminopimelate epimerase